MSERPQEPICRCTMSAISTNPRVAASEALRGAQMEVANGEFGLPAGRLGLRKIDACCASVAVLKTATSARP